MTEVMISSLKPEVQYEIQKNQKKYNPDKNDTLNDQELSTLLSEYGADSVKELQKGFIEGVVDNMYPDVLDAKYVGNKGKVKVTYTNGDKIKYDKASDASTPILSFVCHPVPAIVAAFTGLCLGTRGATKTLKALGWGITALSSYLGVKGIKNEINYYDINTKLRESQT